MGDGKEKESVNDGAISKFHGVLMGFPQEEYMMMAKVYTTEDEDLIQQDLMMMKGATKEVSVFYVVFSVSNNKSQVVHYCCQCYTAISTCLLHVPHF